MITVNGTHCIIKHVYSEKIIEAEIIAGEYKGNRLMIPRVILSSSDSKFPYILKRRQFPIRPAFCMTINRCQGQSLAEAEVYLPTSVFSHGQLHVAASRIGDPNNFDFLTFHDVLIY